MRDFTLFCKLALLSNTYFSQDVIQSRRLKLLYLIEADVRIAHGVHKDFGLSDDVQVLDIKNAEAVYSDPR